ncbi:PoNe immunity protein domain-containing protein [Pseudoduganella sp. HUAS MS19]
MIRVLTPNEFQDQRREKLIGYDFYCERASDLASMIPRAQQNLADPEWIAAKTEGRVMLAASGCADLSVDLLTLSYSAGANLADLRAFYPFVFDTWLVNEKFHLAYRESAAGASSTTATYALIGDDFEIVNRMVCFTILLGWGHLLPDLARIIDFNNPRMDGMLERLLSYYVSDRDTSISECTRHLPYFKTLKIFNGSEAERSQLMAEYLEDWYVASRREPYFDSHTRDTSFKGYWSWEAAAITFLLDIDDSSYRTAEFYPADLVDFARRAKLDNASGDKLSAQANELRMKAGVACPKAGTWQSIDVPSTTKVFSEGEIAPDLGSRYGLTVWRYTG